MREICRSEITAAAERLYMRASTMLAPDLAMALECAYGTEREELAKLELEKMIAEFKKAAFNGHMLCQPDKVTVFCELGQEVCVTGGELEAAICEGIACVYVGATPDIYTHKAEGDRLSVTVAFGNFEREIRRIFSAEDAEGFIIEAARGASACITPPLMIGAGLGETAAEAEILAKYALYRPVDRENPDPNYAKTERRTANKINALRIGAGRCGGKNTALSVNIEAAEQMPVFCAVYVSDYRICRASSTL